MRKISSDHESRTSRYFARIEERMSKPFEGLGRKGGSTWAVIFTYNRKDFLEKAARSMRAAEPSIKIIVVDNGSTDGTQQTLVQLYSEGIVDKILLNRHEDVPQWQKAYNIHQVFRLLTPEECEYLVWMDDDVFVRQPFLKPAHSILEQLGSSGVALVSMLTDEDQNSIHATQEEKTIDGVHVRIKGTFNGAFVFFPAALLREIGLPPIREGSDDLSSEDWYYSRLLQSKGMKIAAVHFADHMGVAGNSMREKMFS